MVSTSVGAIIAKNCMKITKLNFLGENNGKHGGGGSKPILGVVGGSHPVHPAEKEEVDTVYLPNFTCQSHFPHFSRWDHVALEIILK